MTETIAAGSAAATPDELPDQVDTGADKPARWPT